MSMAIKHPNLFLVGAPKCGTSSVWAALKESPDIFVPDLKELYFWGPDICEGGNSGASDLAEYLKLFYGGKECEYACDASPSYMYSDHALRCMVEFNPDAKMILMFRDPVEFVVSWHRDRVLYCDEELDLVSAWRAQSSRSCGVNIPRDCRNVECLLYKKLADFGHHLDRVRAIVPCDRVHVVFLEDLRRDVFKVVEGLGKFLECRLSVDAFRVRRNVASEYRSEFLQQLVNNRSNVWYKFVRDLRMRDSSFKKWFKRFVQKPVVHDCDPEVVSLLRRDMREEIIALNRMCNRDFSVGD